MIKRRSVEINNDSSNVSNSSEDSTGSVQMPRSTLYDDSNRSTTIATTTTRRDPPSNASAEGDYSSEINSTGGSRLVAHDGQLADDPESKQREKSTWFAPKTVQC